MTDVTLPLTAAISILSLVASIAGAWGVVRLTGEKNAAELAKLQQSYVELQRDLNLFKLEAARRFVTDEMLAKVEERVIAAIDRLADRLDRLVEARSARRPSN